jgi:hypothetical protein
MPLRRLLATPAIFTTEYCRHAIDYWMLIAAAAAAFRPPAPHAPAPMAAAFLCGCTGYALPASWLIVRFRQLPIERFRRQLRRRQYFAAIIITDTDFLLDFLRVSSRHIVISITPVIDFTPPLIADFRRHPSH